MPSPFPGMDPYLEHPGLWPDVHHELISGIREQLNRSTRPRYVARVEERTYYPEEDDPGLELLAPSVPHDFFIPDVKVVDRNPRSTIATATALIDKPVTMVTMPPEEIREARVEILDTSTRDVVTVIEVVSPSNKVIGSAGRKSFLDKRREIMNSPIHWVEIDLLRGSSSIDSLVTQKRPPHDYCVHVSPADHRPQGRVWMLSLEQPLPTVGIPLRSPDADVGLDLQSVLRTAYERAAYDLTVDYARPPTPPLTKPQTKWAKTLFPKRKRK
jgi:hypothetical protein